jgi:hypothetical protein
MAIQEKLREKADAFLMDGAPKEPMEAQIAGEITVQITRSKNLAMTVSSETAATTRLI